MTTSKTNQVRQVVGIVLGFVAVFVPATLGWLVPGVAAPSTLLATAALGGAIAGRVLVPSGERIRAHLSAIVCGAIAGVGAFAVMRWWIDGRDSVTTLEFIMVALVGSLPGGVLGAHLHTRLRRRDNVVPPATAKQVARARET